MPIFSQIVVPLDGSDHSETALQSACSLARAFNAELRLITVEEVPPVIYPGSANAQRIQEARRDAQTYLLEQAQALRRQGYCVNTQILSPGPPAQRILEELRRNRADLIVVGSHGRTGLGRMLLGSVAERLAREAPCPVLIVRAQNLKS